MLIKRTGVSDFIWGVFVILLAGAATLFWYFSRFVPDESKALISAVLAALTLTAVGLIAHAVGRLSNFLHRRLQPDPAVTTILYIVVMSILFLVMILVRVRYLSTHAEALSDDNGVFAGAMIVSGDAAGSDGILARFTSVLLGVFLRIAGNRLSVACIVLAVVQVITLINATLAVHLLAGRAAAVTGAILTGFLPIYLDNLLVVSENEVFYLLLSIGFLLIALYLHLDARGALTTMVQIVLLIVVGVAIGFLTYIDFGACLLFVPLILTVFLPHAHLGTELVRFFLMLVIGIITFVVFLILGFGIGGIGSGFSGIIAGTLGTPTQVRIFHLKEDFYPFGMALVTLMTIGVVSSFRDKALDRMTIWFLLFFETALLAPLFGTSRINAEGLICFGFIGVIAAGIGCIAADSEKKKAVLQQTAAKGQAHVPAGMVLPEDSEADEGEAHMRPMEAGVYTALLGIDRGGEEIAMAVQEGMEQEPQLDKAAQKALAKARKAQAKADAKAAKEAAKAAKRAEKERQRMLEDEEDDEDYEEEIAPGVWVPIANPDPAAVLAAQAVSGQAPVNVPEPAPQPVPVPVPQAEPVPAPAGVSVPVPEPEPAAIPAPAAVPDLAPVAVSAPAPEPQPEQKAPVTGPISLASSPFMGRAPQTSQPSLIRNTAFNAGGSDDFDFDIPETDDFDV